MKWIIFSIGICTLFATGLVASVDESYYDYAHDEEYQDLERPKFVATPQTFSVQIGDELTFPCETDKKGDPYLLMFKYISPKGKDRLFYVGDTAVGRSRRIRKEGDSSFVLSFIKKSDSGQYVCRFETDPVEELKHTLQVQYPAKVVRLSDEVQRVDQGSSVTLKCGADGNPPPAITWSKMEGGPLPSGARTFEGSELTFEGVTRHVEGAYICTASNGIGEPSSTNMMLEVEYQPEIITEQTIVKKPTGYEAQMMCKVHGRPSPKVTWMRGDVLVSSNKHIMTHDGSSKHLLTIFPLEDDDFGNYTCKAKNLHGEVSSTLRLTGIPKRPEITSGETGLERRSFTLSWKAETFAPITQYRVKYRQPPNSRDAHKKRHQNKWHEGVYPNVRPSPSMTRDAKPFKNGLSVMMRHTVPQLSPARDYEAVIQVENRFGWSDESKVFKFSTKKEIAYGRSAGCFSIHLFSTSSAFLVSVATLLTVVVAAL